MEQAPPKKLVSGIDQFLVSCYGNTYPVTVIFFIF